MKVINVSLLVITQMVLLQVQVLPHFLEAVNCVIRVGPWRMTSTFLSTILVSLIPRRVTFFGFDPPFELSCLFDDTFASGNKG